jgi:uridine kinase
MSKNPNPFIIGIAGGTGSGKTTVAKDLQLSDPSNILILSHDNYYKDHPELSEEERKKLNYDEPAAIDEELFVAQLSALKNGEAIDMPQYDFPTHSRKSATIRVEPKPIIILEGILILTDKRVRDLLDLSIFIDLDADMRLARRLMRDVGERDKTFQESINQYLASAQPMYDKYVEPGKNEADMIIRNEGSFEDLQAALSTIKARIDEVLGKCGI